jgi:hypothetical protein
VTGADVSEPRALHVIDRTVRVRRTRSGISVEVVPPSPYALVSLQLDLRERFGWWPVAQTRLDYVSTASFRVRGPVRARVALLGPDGWTALAFSPVLRIGRA